MGHAEETTPLEIFQNKIKGDTLVISPKGDAAGFSSTLFHKEQESLLKFLKDPQVNHLIVDFGNSTYFGSEMIGAVNQLIVKVHASGGKTGVCNLSVDMKEGIHVMQLDKIWHLYDTRKEAVKAIVTEPIGQKIEHQIEANRRGLFVLGAVGLVVIVLFTGLLLSARNENRRNYNTLMTVWNELKIEQTRSVSEAEKKLIARKNLAKVHPIIVRLKKKGSRRNSGEQKLYSAAKYLEVLLKTLLPSKDAYFKELKGEHQKKKPQPDSYLSKKSPEELKTEFTKLIQSAYHKFGWDENEPKEKRD